MSTATERQSRRNKRQNQRRALLTDEQKSKHPKACEQFVLFGDDKTRTIETFIAEHG